MTCRDTLQCVHEPFGDAWYFGPERLADRYTEKQAKEAIAANGFEDATYKGIFEKMEKDNTEVRRTPPSQSTFISRPSPCLPARIIPQIKRWESNHRLST